jgi:hypothetical protein
MAKKTSQTFAKRQRENARREKQQRKAEKRLERRQQAGTRPPEDFELLDGVVVPVEGEDAEAVEAPVEAPVETKTID